MFLSDICDVSSIIMIKVLLITFYLTGSTFFPPHKHLCGKYEFFIGRK